MSIQIASPYRSFFIGYNSLFDQLENWDNSGHGYPPHNVLNVGRDHYRIELALAGWKQSEIDITVKEDILTVTGTKNTSHVELETLHQGISRRNFAKAFRLSEYVQVSSAIFEDGLLKLDLKHELPEEKKPRKIAITNPQQLLKG